MAKLMLVGKVATVEILQDPRDENLILAKCVQHPGFKGWSWKHWQERYDTMGDAVNYATDHAGGYQ